MLRRLLRDGEDLRELPGKLSLFTDNPGLSEKYVIASEVTLEVLELLFSQIFGKDSAAAASENPELAKFLCDKIKFTGAKETTSESCVYKELLGRVNEHNETVDRIQEQFADLQRQFSALQRQLQIQGDVSHLGATIEARIGQVSEVCERHVHEARETLRGEIQKLDVSARVEAVVNDVGQLKKELSDMASAASVIALSEEVARLKRAEQSLHERLKEVTHAKEFICDEAKPLQGIIAYLTQLCGGNVHEKELVQVRASSVSSTCLSSLKHAVELETDSDFYTENKPGSWICYDFKERRVAPTSYSIRSHRDPPRPKSWEFEVSNDGSSWICVDRREGNCDLLGNGFVTHNFAISSSPGDQFRFLRLRLTGENHSGSNRLDITALEIFGTLSEA